jgi:hypothetical protein
MGSGGGRELTEFGGTGSANTANGVQSAQATRSSVKLDWAAGKAKAGMVYTTFNSSATGAVRNFDADGDATNDSIAAYNVFGALTSITTVGSRSGKTTYTTNLTQLAGSYDFGVVMIGANYNMGSQNITENATSGAAGTTAGAAGSTVDIKSQAISFSMPMGAMVLSGGMGTATTSAAGAATKDISTSQLTLRYNLSKRTAAYGLIGQVKDQTAINANSTSATGYMTQTGVGMMTTF